MSCNDYCNLAIRRFDNTASYNVSCKEEYYNRGSGGNNLTAMVHCSDMCYFCTPETKQDCGDATPTDAFASFKKLIANDWDWDTVNFAKPLYLTCPPPPTRFVVLYVLIPSMLIPVILLLFLWWRTVRKEMDKLERFEKGDFEDHDHHSVASHEEEAIAPLNSLPRSSISSYLSSRGGSLSVGGSVRGSLQVGENQQGRPSVSSSMYSTGSQFLEGIRKGSEEGGDIEEARRRRRRSPEELVTRQKEKLRNAWKSFAIVSVIVVIFVVGVLTLSLVHEWWVYPNSGTLAADARQQVRSGCFRKGRREGKDFTENSCV